MYYVGGVDINYVGVLVLSLVSYVEAVCFGVFIYFMFVVLVIWLLFCDIIFWEAV